MSPPLYPPQFTPICMWGQTKGLNRKLVVFVFPPPLFISSYFSPQVKKTLQFFRRFWGWVAFDTALLGFGRCYPFFPHYLPWGLRLTPSIVEFALPPVLHSPALGPCPHDIAPPTKGHLLKVQSCFLFLPRSSPNNQNCTSLFHFPPFPLSLWIRFLLRPPQWSRSLGKLFPGRFPPPSLGFFPLRRVFPFFPF